MKANEKLYEGLGWVRPELLAEAVEAQPVRQPRRWVRWGMAAAACLVLAGAALIPTLERPQTAQQQNPASDPPTSAVIGEEPGNVLVVNEGEAALGDLDVKIDGVVVLQEQGTFQKFRDCLGVDWSDFSARLPQGWTWGEGYCLLTPHEDGTYQFHDFLLECTAPGGGTAQVALCPTEEPLRDWLLLDEDPEKSLVNGVSLVICGMGDMYLTQFAHDGLYYDVSTQGISLEELEALLSGLLV